MYSNIYICGGPPWKVTVRLGTFVSDFMPHALGGFLRYCLMEGIRHPPVEVSRSSYYSLWRVLYIPGGYVGFLNHQQYHSYLKFESSQIVIHPDCKSEISSLISINLHDNRFLLISWWVPLTMDLTIYASFFRNCKTSIFHIICSMYEIFTYIWTKF